MVFYGIIYALLENDMRRILAYCIVNQVGFMVTGIGIGTEMALNGAARTRSRTSSTRRCCSCPRDRCCS